MRESAQQRALLTHAAKLIVDEGMQAQHALRRAAEALGIRLQQPPSSAQVQDAVREYRDLFRPSDTDRLHQQRQVALQAMRTMQAFRPLLFGGLATGSGPLDTIQLLLTADTAEEVMWHLTDQHIPWREGSVMLHYSGGRRLAQPALRFEAGDSSIELIVLPPGHRSDPPRDPVDGNRLHTIDTAALTALVASA